MRSSVMSARRLSAPTGTPGATRRRLESAASIFAALRDNTRLRLVARLSVGGPTSIARLTQGGSITRQAVTKHLRVLAGAGVVSGSRVGRESLWELEQAP